MWDERYSTEEYAYGTAPNEFLVKNAHHIPKGKVLSLAEGEGRNAVFLAQQGYSVTAVDASLVGLNKARKLAEKKGVIVEFIHASLADYDLGEKQWDGIVSIFCPLPSTIRKSTLQEGNGGTKAKRRVPVGGLHPGTVEIWNWRRQLGRYDAVRNHFKA